MSDEDWKDYDRYVEGLETGGDVDSTAELRALRSTLETIDALKVKLAQAEARAKLADERNDMLDKALRAGAGARSRTEAERARLEHALRATGVSDEWVEAIKRGES